MRKFQTAMEGVVDLNKSSTYSYLPKTEKELDNKMFEEIGKAVVYMDYFPTRKSYYPKKRPKNKLLRSGYEQRVRVEKLIKKFAADRHKYYGDVKWLREQVFLFQDETENMC